MPHRAHGGRTSGPASRPSLQSAPPSTSTPAATDSSAGMGPGRSTPSLVLRPRQDAERWLPRPHRAQKPRGGAAAPGRAATHLRRSASGARSQAPRHRGPRRAARTDARSTPGMTMAPTPTALPSIDCDAGPSARANPVSGLPSTSTVCQHMEVGWPWRPHRQQGSRWPRGPPTTPAAAAREVPRGSGSRRGLSSGGTLAGALSSRRGAPSPTRSLGGGGRKGAGSAAGPAVAPPQPPPYRSPSSLPNSAGAAPRAEPGGVGKRGRRGLSAGGRGPRSRPRPGPASASGSGGPPTLGGGDREPTRSSGISAPSPKSRATYEDEAGGGSRAPHA